MKVTLVFEESLLQRKSKYLLISGCSHNLPNKKT
jgi:hypothetical protein